MGRSKIQKWDGSMDDSTWMKPKVNPCLPLYVLSTYKTYWNMNMDEYVYKT